MRAPSPLSGTAVLSAIGAAVTIAQAHIAWAQKGDLELGRYLASECLTCHRSATATSAIPNIFGMAAPRFITLVKAYREKQLPNEVMQNIAGRLKDEEIEALAHYFAVTIRP